MYPIPIHDILTDKFHNYLCDELSSKISEHIMAIICPIRSFNRENLQLRLISYQSLKKQ